MYEIDKLSYLRIGVQGENVSTTIEVDMTTWADEFPGASFHVLFKPYNADLPSPMTSEYEEPVLAWIVTSDATQTPGVGYTEIRAINPETGLVKKTRIIPTSVENSITPGESSSVPPAYTSWVNSVLSYKEAAETAQEAAEAAAEAAETSAEAAQTSAEAVVNSSVRYDTAQTLTDTQKETARNNIAAYSQADADDLESAMDKRPPVEETDAADSDFDIADSQGYVVARFVDGHIQTKNFDSSQIDNKIAAVGVGFEYKFSGNDLLIGYGYNSTYDAVIVMNCGRANGLFDFAKFALKAKGTPLENMETGNLTIVWNSGTDMHSPFQFNATTNPDGHYSSSTDPSFTGGNHTVTIDGNAVQSASSEYVHYFADGKPVSTGYGRCARFEIRWANNVQAYNCVKADGTGRTSLVEYHDMIFDGVQFNEEIMLMPTEEISMRLWYGLQSVSWNQTYTSARFVDAENRGPFASTDSNVESGNAVTSGIIETGAVHSMKMTVDTGVDLGKRTFYSGTKGAFINRYDTSGKAYFSIIGGRNTWSEGEGYFLRGSFRFYPTVS